MVGEICSICGKPKGLWHWQKYHQKDFINKGRFENGHNIALNWTKERRKKLSNAVKKRRANPKIKRFYSNLMKGKNNPMYGKPAKGKRLEVLRANGGRKGKLCNFYIDGRTPKNHLGRTSKKLKQWKTAVFERDNYTCQVCGIKNEKGVGKTIILNAHHIKPFSTYPKERFNMDNGLTLCKSCHDLTKGRNRGKTIWTREKIKDIIKKTFES